VWFARTKIKLIRELTFLLTSKSLTHWCKNTDIDDQLC